MAAPRSAEHGFIRDLCIHAIRTPGYGAARDDKAAAHSLDWQYVLDKAEEHYLISLAESYTRAVGCWDSLDIGVQERLHTSYSETLARNLACTVWIEEIIAGAASAGIPVMVFKGIAMCNELYGDVALRPFSDIDILVHESDVARCAELLRARALELEPGHDIETLLRVYNHATFHPCNGFAGLNCPLPVELHWGFHESSTPARFRMDMIWAEARPIKIGQSDALTLSYEDELIYGAHHLCHHLFFDPSPALLWLLDLALRITRSGDAIDWAAFREKNTLYGTWITSAVALKLMERLFDISVPAAAGDRLARAVPRSLRGIVSSVEFADLVDEQLVVSPWVRLRSQLALNPGIAPKSSFVASRLRAGLSRLTRRLASG